MARFSSFWNIFAPTYLIIANLILLLCGLGVIGLGAFNMFNPTTFGHGFQLIAFFLFVSGVLVSLIALFGFCGIILESRHLTNSYMIILLIIITIKICISIYSVIQTGRVESASEDIWYNYLFNATREAYQLSKHCCGYLNRKEDRRCHFRRTCAKFFDQDIASTYYLNAVVLAGVVGFEIFNLFFASFVAGIYKKKRKTQDHHQMVDQAKLLHSHHYMNRESEISEYDPSPAYFHYHHQSSQSLSRLPSPGPGSDMKA